jgi:phospholipid-translocating ATPase
MGIVLRHV